jgi:hypothetical protein
MRAYTSHGYASGAIGENGIVRLSSKRVCGIVSYRNVGNVLIFITGGVPLNALIVVDTVHGDVHAKSPLLVNGNDGKSARLSINEELLHTPLVLSISRNITRRITSIIFFSFRTKKKNFPVSK